MLSLQIESSEQSSGPSHVQCLQTVDHDVYMYYVHDVYMYSVLRNV